MNNDIESKKQENNAEFYARVLQKDYLTIASEAIYLVFNQTYRLWEEYKKAKGVNVAMDVYADFWVDFAKNSFRAAVTKLGIKKVNDLATFGKILKYMMSKAPSIYEIIVDEPNLHVGHVLWCANPGMNAFKNRGYNIGSYLRAEGYIADPYLNSYLEEAKKMGLDEDFVITCNIAMCVNCLKECCRYIVHKKNDVNLTLPDLPKSFLYDEIGTENPLPYILKRLNRTFEEQVADSIAGVAFIDYMGWKQMFKQKINDFAYQKLWKEHFKNWWGEVLLELRMAPPDNLQELGIVFINCMKKRFVPYEMKKKTETSIQLFNTVNPFKGESIEQFPEQYIKDMIQVDCETIKDMISYSNLKEEVAFEILSHNLRGDNQTCIELKYLR